MGTRCKLSAGDFSTITGVSVPVLRLLARVRRSHSARVISVRPLSIPSATPLPAFSCAAAPPGPASVLTRRPVRIAGTCREGNADIGTGVCATARGHNRSALRNIVAGGSSSTEAAEAGLNVWYCVHCSRVHGVQHFINHHQWRSYTTPTGFAFNVGKQRCAGNTLVIIVVVVDAIIAVISSAVVTPAEAARQGPNGPDLHRICRERGRAGKEGLVRAQVRA